MDSAKRYGRAIVGIVVAVAVWQILAATNLVGFSVEPKVEDGKLGSISASTAIPIIEAVLSFVAGWAFFAFQRLGDGAIAGVRAILGMSPSAPVSKPNDVAQAEFVADMRRLYDAIQAKRSTAIQQADTNIQVDIKSALTEAIDKVSQ